MNGFSYQKAKKKDSFIIFNNLNKFSKTYNLLPLSLETIKKNIENFWLVINLQNKLIGHCLLFIYNANLAEIRSLWVNNDEQKKGIGSTLLKKCLNTAEEKKIKKVFTLTKKGNLFLKLGFKKNSKKSLPEKIFKDCVNCPCFTKCDEESYIIHSPFF